MDSRRTEWLAGLAGAFIVIALVGFMGYRAIFTAATLPDLRVTVDPPSAGADHLRFTVLNLGGTAASAVAVSVTVREPGRALEKRSVTIDFVPAGSRVHGGFLGIGTDQPAEVIVEGYVDP